MKNLKINDIVCLKNSSQNFHNRFMKIKDLSYSTNKVICLWLNDFGKLETGVFSSTSLKKINNTIKKF